MTASSDKYRPNLDVFGISRNDPGWIYMIKDQDRLKIGRSSTPDTRLRDARTWCPNMELLHLKPFWNVGFAERSLHEGLSRCWYAGEWHKIHSECDCEFMIESFGEFSDENRDGNSVDFIYWMNSTGFAEFCIEIRSQGMTLPKFRKQESDSSK